MGDRDVIVLVDDEEEILDLLTVYLKNENFIVEVFTEGGNAIRYIEENGADLVILDVMLPDTDGFSVCRRLREKYFFPIIMLTAKNEDSDVLNGLTLGADDYITKPFKPMEVVARIKTQLRRFKKYNQKKEEVQEQEVDIRGLYMNGTTHEAKLYEKELPLTPLEFSILYYLCSRQGQVVSSEELFEQVWGEKYIDSNNTVMTHIGRIREKMRESAKKPKFIKTVWGVGYKIE
ncbi:MAG: VanR-ABDEGLN family response regulator transcription factor [Eubacterium sp.]|jgi:Response regulators consisting of a CheY-like receiver domain and a winged-helix DNA-binding domain|nr:VanR-ABDEGLN family response regulator transcription factor [Eubacterium sp.]